MHTCTHAYRLTFTHTHTHTRAHAQVHFNVHTVFDNSRKLGDWRARGVSFDIEQYKAQVGLVCCPTALALTGGGDTSGSVVLQVVEGVFSLLGHPMARPAVGGTRRTNWAHSLLRHHALGCVCIEIKQPFATGRGGTHRQ
jgi:hypothetical protein